MENIGYKIKQLRMMSGLTQAQLAEKSNTSLSLIAKIETEKNSNIKIDTLNNISEALNINIIQLVNNKNDKLNFKIEYLASQIETLDNETVQDTIEIINRIIRISKKKTSKY